MLKKYQSHKIVEAGKILKIENNENPDKSGMAAASPSGAVFTVSVGGNSAFLIAVGPGYMTKHKPEVGGYYVKYPDGYESFSPAEPFESGYLPLSTTEKVDADWSGYVKDQVDLMLVRHALDTGISISDAKAKLGL